MPEYSVKCGDNIHSEVDSLTSATVYAERLASENPGHVFCVVNEDDYLLACASTRQITGLLCKQVFTDPRHDVLYVGQEAFNATASVLLMSLEQLRSLVDGKEAAETLGRDFVSWNGPCYVEVESSICLYFGVMELSEITQEALDYARRRLKPQPRQVRTVRVTLEVELVAAPEVYLEGIERQLQFTAVSLTPDVLVRSVALAP